MKTGIFIPSHLNSERFPKKILTKIKNLEMIEHVRRRALLSKIKNVFVVTDSDTISRVVNKYKGDVLRSKKKHLDGSSRVMEVIKELDYNKILLLQGDEPLIFPSYLKRLNESNQFNNKTVLNLVSKCKPTDFDDENVVKCSMKKNYQIVELFRNKKIFDAKSKKSIFKILGTILYPKELLIDIQENPPKLSKSEKDKSIEQIKILKKGYKIKGILVNKSTLSINTKNDKKNLVKFINNSKIQKKILKKIGL